MDLSLKAILPDTNVLSALFRADAEIAGHFQAAERIVISPVVEGELLGGFRHGSRLAENLARWSAFVDEPYVYRMTLGSESADRYGRIWAQLRRAGTPIPSNDIWIAAHAGEAGAELLSFDAHFRHVEGLIWRQMR